MDESAVRGMGAAVSPQQAAELLITVYGYDGARAVVLEALGTTEDGE